MHHLKNYQQELVKKEVLSLWELGQVGSSFSNVLKGADQFQTKLQNLGTSFSSINETAEQFGQVQEEITHSIAEARGQMEDLDQVSAQVQQSFDAMSETFAQLTAEEKNAISHRGLALEAFQEKLEEYLK